MVYLVVRFKTAAVSYCIRFSGWQVEVCGRECLLCAAADMLVEVRMLEDGKSSDSSLVSMVPNVQTSNSKDVQE